MAPNDLLVPALGPGLPLLLTGGAVAAAFADASGSPVDAVSALTSGGLSGFVSEGVGSLTSGTGGLSSDVDGGVADAATGVSFPGLGVLDCEAKAERRFDGSLSTTNRLGFALVPREPVPDDDDFVMVLVGDMEVMMMMELVVR